MDKDESQCIEIYISKTEQITVKLDCTVHEKISETNKPEAKAKPNICLINNERFLPAANILEPIFVFTS